MTKDTKAEDNQLREYLRLPGGGVSTRALIALAMQDKGASTYDLEYAEALMRSNGWLPPEEQAAEHEIHGLCPGHPIANDPAATCSVCNMSRVTFDKLRAALRSPEGAPADGVVECVACRKVIDPGFLPEACQLHDKRWVCSERCWERAARMFDPEGAPAGQPFTVNDGTLIRGDDPCGR